MPLARRAGPVLTVVLVAIGVAAPAASAAGTRVSADFPANVVAAARSATCPPSSEPVDYVPLTVRTVGGSLQRYYDPGSGQFLSIDPLNQGTNSQYTFVNYNTLVGNDPTGQMYSCGNACGGAAEGCDKQACKSSKIPSCQTDPDLCLEPPQGTGASGSASRTSSRRAPTALCTPTRVTASSYDVDACQSRGGLFGNPRPVSAQDFADFGTGLALVVCFGGDIIVTDGGATPYCVEATAAALAGRVYARIADQGFSGSLPENVGDLLTTTVGFGLIGVGRIAVTGSP